MPKDEHRPSEARLRGCIMAACPRPAVFCAECTGEMVEPCSETATNEAAIEQQARAEVDAAYAAHLSKISKDMRLTLQRIARGQLGQAAAADCVRRCTNGDPEEIEESLRPVEAKTCQSYCCTHKAKPGSAWCAECAEGPGGEQRTAEAKDEPRCTGRNCIRDCGAMLQVDPNCEKHGRRRTEARSASALPEMPAHCMHNAEHYWKIHPLPAGNGVWCRGCNAWVHSKTRQVGGAECPTCSLDSRRSASAKRFVPTETQALAALNRLKGFAEGDGPNELGLQQIDRDCERIHAALTSLNKTDAPAWPVRPKHPPVDAHHLINRLCKLLSRVWEHFEPTGSTANDCFCGDGGFKNAGKPSWRNEGLALAWVEELVRLEIGGARTSEARNAEKKR